MNFLAAILLFTMWSKIEGFNVDTEFALYYKGPKGSYFGYSVALHLNDQGPVVLVGAPKANSSTLEDQIFEPGALFRCNVSSDETEQECEEIALLKEGNTFTWDQDEFSYKERKDGMWLGVSLDARRSTSVQNDVVVCGHLWRNQRYFQTHFVNGICYVINANLDEDSARKLLPLVQKSEQYTVFSGSTEYNYAFGQAGISAAFSEDASNLILGAPGIFSWTGSIVNYPANPGSRSMTEGFTYPVIPFPSYEVNYNSYFGYSVSSGKFFESKELLFAVGAPRDAENHGMVYIVKGEGHRIRIKQKKRGNQLGEYFGASVLGVDLNGDSFTDLLVGAPLYSLESAGDEGKVYVYISNGKDLQKYSEIAGERKPDSRFGAAMANIGDINQDGFTDVAVGAPYEDGRGAVYIYHGSQNGLNSRYEQKIAASDINKNLSGFGIHISHGVDIDENGYPDVLVGSYASSNAVLFRSRPVIHVFSKLTFNPKQILMNTPCEEDIINRTCVRLDACLHYSGQHVPSSLEFKLTALIQDQRRRGFFLTDESQALTSTSRRLVVPVQTTECYSFRMFLSPVIRDIITPIQVKLSHSLKTPKQFENSFGKTHPIYHPSSLTNLTSRVPFHTGCGRADECLSNLSVVARRLDPPENVEFITLGRVSSISIEITVSNEGEPAYSSELHIFLPPEISSINDTCESGGHQRNATLICDTGNPLRNDTQVKMYIKLDTTRIPPHTKYLEIVFEVVTISTETNTGDNNEVLAIFPETVYDIGVTGFTSPDQIIHDGSDALPKIIVHTYIVRNYGPSPLSVIHFSLHVPYELSTSDGSKQIIYFTSVQTETGKHSTVPVSCDDASLNIKAVQTPVRESERKDEDGLLTIQEDGKIQTASSPGNVPGPPGDLKTSAVSDKKPDVVQNEKDVGDKTNTHKIRTVGISCESENIRCIELLCSATSFSSPRKYAEISVSFYLNFTILDKYLGQWYHIELETNSSIWVKDGAAVKQNIYPDAAQAKTDILHEGPPPPEELKYWIIFVSIGVGGFLLLIILVIFVKIGFFRRKEKDKMKRMLSVSKSEKAEEKNDDEETIKDEDYCEKEDE